MFNCLYPESWAAGIRCCLATGMLTRPDLARMMASEEMETKAARAVIVLPQNLSTLVVLHFLV